MCCIAFTAALRSQLLKGLNTELPRKNEEDEQMSILCMCVRASFVYAQRRETN